ncbi:MAG TPA: bifunctional phosphoglucose/phosphomannose isomerase [Acidimicrobiales bacterium]|nr:bifunctional phosphoglucose/phosphomannose isomerase [Acidimicrobiales bacterium]
MPVVDSIGMFALAESFPEQVADAFREYSKMSGLPRREDIENVVVLGMGGSGVAGDVLAAVAAPLLPIPVTVVKGYECPHFVGEGSLVFAISASGDTEETIQAASDAALAGAKMVAVTAGGELAQLASGWGIPLVRVPPGIPQPRAALGAMTIPLLAVLWRMGLLAGANYWVEQAVRQLGHRRDELATAGDASAAAEVARRIGATVPLIHGGGPLGSVAACRWRTQVNENAKRPAFSNSQPELCHNEICAWAPGASGIGEFLTVVTLRHDAEHPQVARRFDISAKLAKPWVAGIVEIRAEGEGDLAQLLDLIYYGDYVSLWLAALSGVDPGPVDVLASVKHQLAGA